MRGGGRVLRRIGGAGGQRIRRVERVRVRERLQIGGRHGDFPVTAAVHRTGVGFGVQGHGDHRSGSQTGGAAGNIQRRILLLSVNHIVLRDSVNHQRRLRGRLRGKDHAVVCRSGIPRQVSDGDRDRLRAVRHHRDLILRDGQRPSAVSRDLSSIGLPVEGNGDRPPLLDPQGRAANHQPALPFRRVDKVVAGDFINLYDRRARCRGI